MDPTKDDVDEQMAELREALRDINLTPEDLTIKHVGTVPGNYGYESILSSSGADTITLSGLGAYNNTVIGAGYNTMAGLGAYTNTGPYTISTSMPSNTTWMNGVNSGRISLDGDEADIVVNGVSLMDLLKDRLNIMIPDPRMEKEWDQLRELGDQYRALEKKLKEQSEMWAKLKSMPPPELL